MATILAQNVFDLADAELLGGRSYAVVLRDAIARISEEAAFRLAAGCCSCRQRRKGLVSLNALRRGDVRSWELMRLAERKHARRARGQDLGHSETVSSTEKPRCSIRRAYVSNPASFSVAIPGDPRGRSATFLVDDRGRSDRGVLRPERRSPTGGVR